jgi:hypothetical protein
MFWIRNLSKSKKTFFFSFYMHSLSHEYQGRPYKFGSVFLWHLLWRSHHTQKLHCPREETIFQCAGPSWVRKMYPPLRGRRLYIFIFRECLTAYRVRLLEKKLSRNSRDNTCITIRNTDVEIWFSCLFGTDNAPAKHDIHPVLTLLLPQMFNSGAPAAHGMS